jgi:hypothetical protein
MRALVRYVGDDTLRDQRWLAPALTFLAILAVLDATDGAVRSTYAASAALLLPVAAWVTVVVNRSEDPAQTAITAVNAGSPTRVQLAKLIASGLGCLLLVFAALVAPLLTTSHGWSVSDVGLGVVAHLLCAMFGVALGAVCSPPVLRRPAWVVVAVVSVSLADVLIPNCPPARQVLALLGSEHPRHVAATLALTSAQTIAASAALVAIAVVVARRRD